MEKLHCERSYFLFEYSFLDENKRFKPSTGFSVVTAAQDGEFELHWEIEYLCSPIFGELVYSFERIEVGARDVPPDVTADAKVFVEGHLCFEARFDAEFSSTAREIVPSRSLNVFSSCDLRVQIVVGHRSSSVGQVLRNYRRLLATKRFNEVEFVVGEERIPANKEVLAAQSPVFASMFECDMAERRNGTVRVTDVEPGVFKLLLQFVYFGRLEHANLGVDNWLKLIIAADKYSLTGLIKVCECRVSEMLNVDNAVNAFVTADLVNSGVLKERCMDFIFKNRNAVVLTDGYRSLIENWRADLLSELFCNIHGFMAKV